MKAAATEAALLRVLYQHLLAALAFVHVQRVALTRVQNFVRQSGRSPATTNNIEERRGHCFQDGCNDHLGLRIRAGAQWRLSVTDKCQY